MLPYGSLNAVALPELALDSASRPLGILATLLGRFEDAAGHFEEAMQMNERMGLVRASPTRRRTMPACCSSGSSQGDRQRAQGYL